MLYEVITNIRYWEYNSIDLETGNPVDVSQRHPDSRQLRLPEDAEWIERYSDPAFVLGRITSYNVCYTKLLRAKDGWIHLLMLVFLAWNPSFTYYASEARSYQLLLLFVLVSVGIGFSCFSRQRSARFLFLAGVSYNFV